LKLDVLIIGGGGAGLWLLDELVRAGLRVLLVENRALGAGQTVASQGIIHGGIKYTLAGALTESARSIREMPGLWRDCLRGRRSPDLSATRVLSDRCYLWRTSSLKSRLGLLGARAGLRSGVERVAVADRPAVLAGCPGEVSAVDEQVIDTVSFLRTLGAVHGPLCLKTKEGEGVRFFLDADRRVSEVELVHPRGDETIRVQPDHVILTAGEGNAALRAMVGLSADEMQRRPLHMLLVRGPLPMLFGHCVDGAKTRVTITSATDADGRIVWTVGGQVSEDGVRMSPAEFIAHACRELAAVLPGVSFADTQWSSYTIDRAEARTPGGVRPHRPEIRIDGNVITAWPTKLALVPELARLVRDRLGIRVQGGHDPQVAGRRTDFAIVDSRDAAQAEACGSGELAAFDWPRPGVAEPPWERCTSWR
jgi:glycerol-3-phosphate dehydrogenase